MDEKPDYTTLMTITPASISLMQVQSSNGYGSFSGFADPRRVALDYDWVAAALQDPAQPNDALKALLRSPSPWSTI